MKKNQFIRNFCIIAHIDHGKSTLADRLIEFTGAISKREIKDRILDTLELEQERGITIKLQTARLIYSYHGENAPSGEYILNLIDTPGHVDFSYEVSRSVGASEGALLLVDATQGIQAQTFTTVYKAMEFNLKIIPVINKVDMDIADVEKTKQEIIDNFGFSENEIILASGKTGLGVKEILDKIVEEVPSFNLSKTLILPDEDEIAILEGKEIKTSKALIFDAFFHEYKGVTALIKVVNGEFNKGEKISFLGTRTELVPLELGYLTPKMTPVERISIGEVGYIATGLKDINKVHSGDTVTVFKGDDNFDSVFQLKGYRQPKPMVYASLYPVDGEDFENFRNALEKLSLNDAALTYQKEFSQALGNGFVCGFLGLLHLEITQDRLEREYGINLISTIPTVEFMVELSTSDYSKIPNVKISNIIKEKNIAKVRTASEFPEGSLIKSVLEPWVKLLIFTPEEYIGPVMQLCQNKRGVYKHMEFITKGKKNKHTILEYEIPTLEIIVNFFDKLKSITHGYASMDYSFLEYRKSEIVKVSILVNYEVAESLSFLVHKDNAQRRGKEMVDKLKELIPRQQFKIPIQAALGGQVIARETIPSYRKDVLAKLYGGDVTRKLKLLEKQKKGKKKMKAIGSVEIPKEAFLAALKID